MLLIKNKLKKKKRKTKKYLNIIDEFKKKIVNIAIFTTCFSTQCR